MDNYLYFPKCKITRADYIPGYNSKSCTLLIRSLQNTPKHYPKHFMLTGKPDFFFKINATGITWPILHGDSFRSIFGKDIDIEHIHKAIGLEVSVIAYFNPEEEVKLECFGLGSVLQEPVLFSNSKPLEENKAFVKIAMLGYQLGNHNTKKEKRQKI